MLPNLTVSIPLKLTTNKLSTQKNLPLVKNAFTLLNQILTPTSHIRN